MAKFELLLIAMLAIGALAFPRPARIVRSADPDPHHHEPHHHFHSGYFETHRGHGGYDGYNHDRHYHHERPYHSPPSHHNHGGNSQAYAGAYGSSYGNAAFATANSQAGSGFF